MPQLPQTPQDALRQQHRIARLARGQSLRIWLPADSMIVVQDGDLALVEPLHWLDGQPFGMQIPLAGGQAHRLPRAGWVEMQATTPAEFLCMWITPLPWRLRIWQALVEAARFGRRRYLAGRTG